MEASLFRDDMPPPQPIGCLNAGAYALDNLADLATMVKEQLAHTSTSPPARTYHVASVAAAPLVRPWESASTFTTRSVAIAVPPATAPPPTTVVTTSTTTHRAPPDPPRPIRVLVSVQIPVYVGWHACMLVADIFPAGTGPVGADGRPESAHVYVWDPNRLCSRDTHRGDNFAHTRAAHASACPSAAPLRWEDDSVRVSLSLRRAAAALLESFGCDPMRGCVILEETSPQCALQARAEDPGLAAKLRTASVAGMTEETDDVFVLDGFCLEWTTLGIYLLARHGHAKHPYDLIAGVEPAVRAHNARDTVVHTLTLQTFIARFAHRMRQDYATEQALGCMSLCGRSNPEPNGCGEGTRAQLIVLWGQRCIPDPARVFGAAAVRASRSDTAPSGLLATYERLQAYRARVATTAAKQVTPPPRLPERLWRMGPLYIDAGVCARQALRNVAAARRCLEFFGWRGRDTAAATGTPVTFLVAGTPPTPYGPVEPERLVPGRASRRQRQDDARVPFRVELRYATATVGVIAQPRVILSGYLAPPPAAVTTVAPSPFGGLRAWVPVVRPSTMVEDAPALLAAAAGAFSEGTSATLVLSRHIGAAETTGDDDVTVYFVRVPAVASEQTVHHSAGRRVRGAAVVEFGLF